MKKAKFDQRHKLHPVTLKQMKYLLKKFISDFILESLCPNLALVSTSEKILILKKSTQYRIEERNLAY